MNKTERRAFEWLKSHYSTVQYYKNKTPNFLADGTRFEVKRAYGGKIVVFPFQIKALEPTDRIIVFRDEDTEPIADIDWLTASTTHRAGQYEVYIPSTFVNISVTPETHRGLLVLKEAWRCSSFDDLLVRLMTPNNLDKLKALDIPVKEVSDAATVA